MATTFPTSIDTFQNPTGGQLVSAVVVHSLQHSNLNDSVTALESKVGVDSSAVTTTLDYKLKNTASIDPGHKHTEGSLNTSDITTNNVSSTKHGYAPKSPADATQFMNGAATPVYVAVKDSDLATTDITTNNVSTTKHGFAPKGDGSTTKFLNANGVYSTPSAGSQFPTTQVYNTTAPTGSYTDLDLSSVIGTNQKLVLLKIVNNGGSTDVFHAIRKGDGATYNSTNSVHGTNSGSVQGGLTCQLIVATNTSGVIQWVSNLGQSTTITVEAYW